MELIQKQAGALIPEISALIRPAPITPKSPAVYEPNNKWKVKWLRLNNRQHPKITALEKAVGCFCFEAWQSPAKGRLLVLAGPNGTGKTHCARRVHKWVQACGGSLQFVARANHVTCLTSLFWSWPELLDYFKSGGWRILSDLFAAPMLILDDLGAAHDPSSIGTEKLSQILSRREYRWTLATTNILPEEWEQQFDRRITSRMYRNSIIVDLSGLPDYQTTETL